MNSNHSLNGCFAQAVLLETPYQIKFSIGIGLKVNLSGFRFPHVALLETGQHEILSWILSKMKNSPLGLALGPVWYGSRFSKKHFGFGLSLETILWSNVITLKPFGLQTESDS